MITARPTTSAPLAEDMAGIVEYRALFETEFAYAIDCAIRPRPQRGRFSCARSVRRETWPGLETDEDDTNYETLVRHLLEGHVQQSRSGSRSQVKNLFLSA
jgi:hypothetical protein